jgi:hypothetical protein
VDVTIAIAGCGKCGHVEMHSAGKWDKRNSAPVDQLGGDEPAVPVMPRGNPNAIEGVNGPIFGTVRPLVTWS